MVIQTRGIAYVGEPVIIRVASMVFALAEKRLRRDISPKRKYSQPDIVTKYRKPVEIGSYVYITTR